MNPTLEAKFEQLKSLIADLESVVVAFSGGIDSTLVLKVAHDVLGTEAVGVTADSPSVPRSELVEAKKIAKKIGSLHMVIETQEINDENYAKNPKNRCYFCKSELYSQLVSVARQLGVKNILNGTNLDDLGDYRPGLEAADEYSVISPLVKVGLNKEEVRELAKFLEIPIWDKPSSPCLSSRIPYGEEVTPEKLAMVEEAEKFLKTFKIRELRVRHFGLRARIEVHSEDHPVIKKNLPKIREKFDKIGFTEIKIAPFKSGSLNVLANIAHV